MAIEDSEPGVSRTISKNVNGSVFTMRIPSRADESRIVDLFSAKVTRTGTPLETDMLNGIDGDKRMWEARFERLLVPRISRQGLQVNLGESAPTRWLEAAGDPKNPIFVVSFDNVDPEEFDDVVAAFTGESGEPIWSKKKTAPPPPPRPPGSSIDSAGALSSE